MVTIEFDIKCGGNVGILPNQEIADMLAVLGNHLVRNLPIRYNQRSVEIQLFDSSGIQCGIFKVRHDQEKSV